MYLMRNHDVWIYVRCANSDPRIAFDRLYDLIDEAAGHGFLVRGTSFDHCSGNTLKDRIGLRSMLDAVENGRIEAVMVRDLEQISRNSYILVGVIEALRQNDVYLITTECDLNAELINSGVERFVGDRFTRASFGKPRFDVRLPLMEQDISNSLVSSGCIINGSVEDSVLFKQVFVESLFRRWRSSGRLRRCWACGIRRLKSRRG